MLSKATGYSCIGKDPFYVGTEKMGPTGMFPSGARTCNGGKKYMIAISPDAIGSTKVFSCSLFHGHPLECYEKLAETKTNRGI